ncbi:DUF5130 family protein [Modestobacter sp. VKM Ac-2978]|uniref:DUF5130 family protein n=1 Tax=Modestobacter sp. VKM Ac-2978 TaxID=3004132 RepID=UPI0022AA99A9|nr:DUF5130 family protein [Modestobacter sp. VKM Ac-2978]MCZ2847307.1 DUF5130 family protein [Modestobacter sp. VKM Ac-2978]
MTQQLSRQPAADQYGPSATRETGNSSVMEPGSGPFSYRDLARLDEALTMSSRETGLRFTLYVGELGSDTRATAEDLHSRSGGDTANSVLVALSPGQRVLEIVTGTAAARRLPDRACALAVLSMTSRLGAGDLVGAIINGLRQLSDAAGHPARRKAD